MSQLEDYFSKFRKNIIGTDQIFQTPFGLKKIVYADWTASGRMYGPIERLIASSIAPFVGNTHTETTVTGCSMTLAYKKSKDIIKKHVNANESDVLISSNSGMTGVVNKFQRILGLRVHEKFRDSVCLENEDKPIVFVTHMEHHSNQTSWLETLVDVEIINPTDDGLVDLSHLDKLIEKYADRKTKIAAVTSCSNVTGIKTPYLEISKKMHAANGLCFVDFACSAPYIDMNMHAEEGADLDAIYFSPHKFLGGPSSTGILIFNQKLYNNKIPDNPGGGTVDWTNPWGEHKYYDAIEAREDGGTPAFLQTIRVALCIKLKDEMGVQNILDRENELLDIIWPKMQAIPNLHILASNQAKRLGVFSFYIDDLHFNLGVKLLNDRFGIQVRGGCSCAGTYGHYLLNVGKDFSNSITCKINEGILEDKPGWIRMSIHPCMTDAEALYVMDAIDQLAKFHKDWALDYNYDKSSNEFTFKDEKFNEMSMVDEWFEQALA